MNFCFPLTYGCLKLDIIFKLYSTFKFESLASSASRYCVNIQRYRVFAVVSARQICPEFNPEHCVIENTVASFRELL